MNIHVSKGKLKGTINATASKSLTHRALIAASLSFGESYIKNPLFSEDTLQTIEILKHLGIVFQTRLDHISVNGGSIKHANHPLFAQESGSTLRFLIPVALLTGEEEHFVLSESLSRRPMHTYETLFIQRGIYYHKENENIFVKGPLFPGEYIIPGDVSSQFISGLLFVLPLLNEDSEIVITGVFESRSYVLLTVQVLKAFGIHIDMKDSSIYIRGNQSYQPTQFLVEGDFSQAAFFLVASALGHDVRLSGLNLDSLQGDKKIINFLEAFGSLFEDNDGEISFKEDKQKDITIDITDTPDLGPILFVLAALSSKPVKITGTKRLKYKESDRITAMCKNLRKTGAKFRVSHNEIQFRPSKLKGGVVVDSFNDHRVAMSLSILATFLEGGLTIKGAECVNKSYPTFYIDFMSLGGEVSEVE